ncbi:MAG: putative ABC transporter permease [Clostridia bacterium]
MNKIIYFFVAGTLGGFVIETLFKILTNKENVSSGLLNGPFCILYGIGTAFMSVMLTKYKDNIWLLFINSALWLSLFEFITGIVLEKVYKTKLWDYTGMFLSIGGKVCFTFTLIWGVLGVVYIKLILPVLTFIYTNANPLFINAIISTIFIIIVIDTIYTNVKIIGFKKYD